jgi:hypothetical protein
MLIVMPAPPHSRGSHNGWDRAHTRAVEGTPQQDHGVAKRRCECTMPTLNAIVSPIPCRDSPPPPESVADDAIYVWHICGWWQVTSPTRRRPVGCWRWRLCSGPPRGTISQLCVIPIHSPPRDLRKTYRPLLADLPLCL